MSLSLKQQMRFLKETDPVLFEAINKCYHRSLYESEEYADNVKETTKGVQALLQKVHNDVGINPNQKEGTQIYTKTPEDEIPDATIIPEQNPLAYGINPSESVEDDDIFGDLFMDDESAKKTTAADESTTSEENKPSESESDTSTVTEEDTKQSGSADTKEKDEDKVMVDDDI